MTEITAENLATIAAELDWLDAVIAMRFATLGATQTDANELALPPAPLLVDNQSAYASLARALQLDDAGRLLLVLALAPGVAPERLDPFLLQNASIGRRFTEFGGLAGEAHVGFLPSLATARFLIRGTRVEAGDPMALLHHPLLRRGLIEAEQRHADDLPMAAALRLSVPALHLLLYGDGFAPPPSAAFPATRITTNLDWNDLVLDAPTMRQI
jgi:hypothetical protein